MKILIVGAGIAGNALALNLYKTGHSVTVVEKHHALRTSGLQVDLRGQGIQVLKLMGMDAAFRAHSVPERGMQVVDSAGKRWGYFPVNDSGKGKQAFTSEYEIMRGDFCRILYEECGSGVEFRFGTTLKKLEERDGGVHVSFGDGKEEVFDLVVGADGQWSRTRRMVFGDGGMKMMQGTCVAYFTMEKEGDDFLATMFMSGKKGGIMTRRQNKKHLQVYIGCSTDNVNQVKRGDVEAEKDLLAEVFAGAGWESEEIVSAMRTAEDFYFERLGLVKLDKWSKGRVVLLGDAAYCPTAMTGMGTTSALVGAYVLAGEIQKYCREGGADADVAKALNGYESKLRPFMEAVTKRVKTEGGGMGFPESRLGMMLMLWGMRIATALKLNSLADMFAMKEIKWELPRY